MLCSMTWLAAVCGIAALRGGFGLAGFVDSKARRNKGRGFKRFTSHVNMGFSTLFLFAAVDRAPSTGVRWPNHRYS